ncbi:hypothetical protein [Kurthia sibirica]|uniref:Uncharacterized protein n=1 Tax=Kurthia sibirica TaxID=202750 RepID=A0A2U3AP94_9BACL|nr:hypothetical protein [Kurthia sibirica]PWI26329.1 hypothetical protein DEX24_03050 [Kurthia sibirica]GEK35703.1 hypothetical protein KSI01_32360 [Kurthia sibirica]
MNYPYMYPPFNLKDFESMSLGEAQQYFDWYTAEIPSRMRFLKQMIAGKFELDFSSKSLIPLFTWYLTTINRYKLSDSELHEKLTWFRHQNELSYEVAEIQLLSNPIDIMLEDYALAMDIAIYYGEVLIHNYPQVGWTFFTKPKSFVHLNEPILDVIDDTGYLRKNPRSLLHQLIEQFKADQINNHVLYENFLLDRADILGVDDED